MTKIDYLRKCAEEKREAADLHGAAEIGEIILTEHEHNKSTLTTEYADDMFNLACVYEELENLERAAMLYSDSAARIGYLDGENLPFALRINNLASVLFRLGLKEPAIFMLKSVLEIRRRELGKNDPLYADSLYNFANAISDTNKKEAKEYHLEALNIRNGVGNVDDVINSILSIAFLHESVQDYKDAIKFAKVAVEISNKKNFISSCNYLAELFEKVENYETALKTYEIVLKMLEKDGNKECSAYLNVALKRATILAALDRPEESLEAHKTLCNALSDKGARNIFYANCLRGMSIAYKALNEYEFAEKTILDAMKIRRTLFEDITLDIAYLIGVYLKANKPDEALEALVYAMMCSGVDSADFPELLYILLSAYEDSPLEKNAFIDAMEKLNDKKKLHPIISKWEKWESS